MTQCDHNKPALKAVASDHSKEAMFTSKVSGDSEANSQHPPLQDSVDVGLSYRTSRRTN